MFPLFTSLSESTQMSSGSLSPTISVLPVLVLQYSATCLSQYVCGTNPYRQGILFENFCGRSTIMYPLSLSTSYLIVSEGIISINALIISGWFFPMLIPCHGCATNLCFKAFANFDSSSFIYYSF